MTMISAIEEDILPVAVGRVGNGAQWIGGSKGRVRWRRRTEALQAAPRFMLVESSIYTS
jgi:hypothetical protein